MKYTREKIDWEAIKKSIDEMFPPRQRKRDKVNPYPLDDTATKKRVIERLRKRKEKQQQ